MATSRPSRFPRVPYAQIQWLVGALHVGDPDETIRGEIESRMLRKTGPGGVVRPGFRPAEVREAVRYALAVHEDNRKFYAQVMRGGSRR